MHFDNILMAFCSQGNCMISLRPQSLNFQASWENHCKQQLKSLFDDNCNQISAIQLYS